jgi:hypothetical protein
MPLVIEDMQATRQFAWDVGDTDEAIRMRRYRQGNAYANQSVQRTDARAWRSGKSGKKDTLLELPICAVDGEGVTHANGTHHYVEFCAAWQGGRYRITGESLSTAQCFEFLLSLPPGHVYVGYGLSYDTNMWVRMLPYAVIDALLDAGKAQWKPPGKNAPTYSLEWIERKFFRIASGGRSFTVYDVLANWQVTFVKALEAWNVGTPDERAFVAWMKDHRKELDKLAHDEVERYCFLECELLRALCRKLFDAILETSYRPRAVYGPGALAAAALEKHGIKKHMQVLPEPVNTLTRHAYFGGRFDCAMFGWFSDIWQYDIKSAYPDQIRFLPCLAHAQWEHEMAGFERIRPRKYGLYHVEFEVSSTAPWPPFPHRTAHGNVYYPYVGSGWYHADEVDAAQAMYGSDAIRILEAWHLTPNCIHKPFDFVDSLYALRKQLETTGGYDRGIVIKLILNSLYGKLAQQVGGRNGKPPPFQCFFWAGAITAGTRAKILRALADNPDDVIGIATDSLVSMRELDFLPQGSELGEWDFKHLNEYIQVSNGVYHGTYDAPPKEAGKTAERARGLGRFVLDYKAVERDFTRSQGAGTHTYPARGRFITLREARQSLDRAAIECRWTGADTPNAVAPRNLDFWPKRRWLGRYARRGPQGGPVTYLEPYAPDDYGADHESQPFALKDGWQDVIDARMEHHSFAWQDSE